MSAPTREGTAWGLCLTAPPGSGKSAIFGEVHRRLTKNGVFVLAHAAAASARAASVDDMLRRWIEELGPALGTDPGLADNADPDTLDATFRSLLGRMAEGAASLCWSMPSISSSDDARPVRDLAAAALAGQRPAHRDGGSLRSLESARSARRRGDAHLATPRRR